MIEQFSLHDDFWDIIHSEGVNEKVKEFIDYFLENFFKKLEDLSTRFVKGLGDEKK